METRISLVTPVATIATIARSGSRTFYGGSSGIVIDPAGQP